ncbi:hypothetical protein GL4_0633 [Methyloceanibacter caenitepidi]|uniref:Calcineurin-like phosphoesterase domain-containing protein n=2 Tax=Methyloceanibacter caenitepidi TaxID=1384459 RepID=A0A0A8K016_9HYPH|nr:hypothetical protein GL4_0633 [Methyloceanibacter caenitepidi]
MDPSTLRRWYKWGLEEGFTVDVPAPPAAEAVVAGEDTAASPETVRLLLAKRPHSLAELSKAAESSIGEVLNCVDELLDQGVNIHRRGDVYEIPKDVQPAFAKHGKLQYVSRPDNTFLFGASGDQHIGSKYARYDALDDLYDRFEAAGVDRVFNTGNWIDGDARFNKFDVEAHGLEAQCALLADRFPKRDGIETYAIWGDDHEGWYAQREGVDVGRYAEGVMTQAGREDWHDIGFMESHIELVNANTGATAILAVVHPGGGSAYALSYSIQKIVESYEGGEKPNVALYGHYHKLWAGLIRNVWVAQTGCTQDQTVFMRKKRLEAHVGGLICGLEQDPETGAILSFSPQIIRYFNEAWYAREGRANDRWSYTKPARMLPRSPSAIR